MEYGGFRSPQVCELAGVTFRQLDYWARCGYIRPSISVARGSGTQRRWTTADVARVRVLGRCSRIGTPSFLFRQIARHLDGLLADGLRDSFLVFDPDGRCEVVDGWDLGAAVAGLGVCTVVALAEDADALMLSGSATTASG